MTYFMMMNQLREYFKSTLNHLLNLKLAALLSFFVTCTSYAISLNQCESLFVQGFKQRQSLMDQIQSQIETRFYTNEGRIVKNIVDGMQVKNLPGSFVKSIENQQGKIYYEYQTESISAENGQHQTLLSMSYSTKVHRHFLKLQMTFDANQPSKVFLHSLNGFDPLQSQIEGRQRQIKDSRGLSYPVMNELNQQLMRSLSAAGFDKAIVMGTSSYSVFNFYQRMGFDLYEESEGRSLEELRSLYRSLKKHAAITSIHNYNDFSKLLGDHTQTSSLQAEKDFSQYQMYKNNSSPLFFDVVSTPTDRIIIFDRGLKTERRYVMDIFTAQDQFLTWSGFHGKHDLKLEFKLKPSYKHDHLVRFHPDPVNDKSVDVISKKNGIHGGSIYILKRQGASWSSTYQDHINALQGDPRWNILIFGRTLAEYFGFKMLSDTEMTAPDAKEFNAALKKLNAKLPAHLKILLKLDDSDLVYENLSEEDFLKMFVISGVVPFAKSGTTLIHDLSYHIGTILWPREIVLRTQKIGKLLLDFLDYAQPRLQQEFPQEASDIRSLIVHHLATYLDASSGNFSQFYAYRLERSFDVVMEIEKLVGYGSVAERVEQALTQSFEYTSDQKYKHLELYYSANNQKKLKRLLQIYHQFIGERSQKDASILDSFSYPLEKVVEDIQQINTELRRRSQ